MVKMWISQLLGIGKERKSLGVCIPDAHRKRLGEKITELQPEINGTGSAFMVTGVFHVRNELTLQGKMLQGKAKAGSIVELLGKSMKLSSVSVGSRPAEALEEGENGVLFLNAKSCPILKAGDVIEF